MKRLLVIRKFVCCGGNCVVCGGLVWIVLLVGFFFKVDVWIDKDIYDV